MQKFRETVLVFANGELDDVDSVTPHLGDAQVVIAADGGIRHLMALGSVPDFLIGDLDSLPDGVDDFLAGKGAKVIQYPSAKDETDLELALLFASNHYPSAELLILGGFGGRIDQTLANILLLAHPQLLHRRVRFIHGRETAWLITGDATIKGREGDIVSLIPLGGSVRVLNTTGLRWQLHDEILDFGPARGISNEMIADRATVLLDQGVLLCVHAAISS